MSSIHTWFTYYELIAKWRGKYHSVNSGSISYVTFQLIGLSGGVPCVIVYIHASVLLLLSCRMKTVMPI